MVGFRLALYLAIALLKPETQTCTVYRVLLFFLLVKSQGLSVTLNKNKKRILIIKLFKSKKTRDSNIPDISIKYLENF